MSRAKQFVDAVIDAAHSTELPMLENDPDGLRGALIAMVIAYGQMLNHVQAKKHSEKGCVSCEAALLMYDQLMSDFENDEEVRKVMEFHQMIALKASNELVEPKGKA